MKVELSPEPMIEMDLLVMVSGDDHVQFPAGMRTVSPSEAFATAALTLLWEQLGALVVAAQRSPVVHKERKTRILSSLTSSYCFVTQAQSGF